MRRALLCTLVVAFCVAPAALAQPRAKLTVSQVRTGFRTGNATGDADTELGPLFKAGAWTPIYIDITAGPPGLKGNEGRIDIVVETPDADDVATNYTVSEALPEMVPGATHTVLAYTKLAGASSTVTINLRGSDGQPLATPYKREHMGIPPGRGLYLTVGSTMPNLRQSLKGGRGENPNAPPTADFEDVAFVDRIGEAPRQWFGYDGINLVLLSTSRRNDFLMELANTKEKRPAEALADWVERGGQIVICVSKNHDVLDSIDALKALLPVKINKSEPVKELQLIWQDARGGAVGGLVAGQGRGPIEVAVLEPKPGRMAQVLMSRPVGDGTGKELPLIVQAPYGMGRVTVVAFDLDTKPFADWKEENQRGFWGELLKHAGGRNISGIEAADNQPINAFLAQENYGELVNQIQNHLENFEEVPVISFGWVALFILIYIIVVGPLDYFFLKKVVKRLELTWITFPTVVLAVSAIAYFAAYQLKGHDLRVRKLDVVDVDLHTQQTFGHTWFTIFSPRIQHYTIGIEPAPEWTAPPAEGSGPAVLTSWLDRPQMDMFGRQRSRGQSLFRRSYDYEPDAVALKGVPIQVWSTKSFMARWQAKPNTQQPLFSANLRHPPADIESLSGEITWRPGDKPGVDLQDAWLVYRGKVHPFPLLAGTPKRVDTLPLLTGGEGMPSWLRTPLAMTPVQTRNPRRGWMEQTNGGNIDATMRAALFYQGMEKATGIGRNSSLRALDQAWRVREDGKDEAILVARLALKSGPADEVTQAAQSASRLWLGALPAPGVERPPLVGMMRQETYVRVFIPVQQ